MDLLPNAQRKRKRVANFSAYEKALLTRLIKKRPIIESKLTDGKTVVKKQAAWESLSQEFNSNGNVQKRETITLKRAWDNMKAITRKARAAERGGLRTLGGAQVPRPPPEYEANISMVEEAAPMMICEIENPFDSEGVILHSRENDVFVKKETITPHLTKTNSENGLEENFNQEVDKTITLEESENSTDSNDEEYCMVKTKHKRRPTDYIRREAAIRMKHFKNKKKIEMQILKVKLRAALLEEEKNKLLLERAKIELEIMKKSM
ncbi:hypothetical protein PYW07_012899 [Mythimna separata]|uniref:Regulatory protein zeste n=1 Tax=Mythimna separata TaxID=271217 RepID=A0AAD8DLQ7_MYTSE|nr:hypothetical protein PYW07_012899 [Mythimna separata]